MLRRLVVVLATAGLALATLVGPASAATSAAPTAAPSGSVTSGPAIACAPFAGHYCARIFFTSVAGGIRVNQTRSTGYNTGAGRGREWFRYTCTAGTCFVVPSRTFFYGNRLTQLNVTRTFGGGGFFLPCGNRFGVDYFRPAVNAPGPGPILFRVTCAANGTGHI